MLYTIYDVSWVGLQLPCNPKLWKQLRLWMSRHEREVKYVHLNTFFSLFVTDGAEVGGDLKELNSTGGKPTDSVIVFYISA